MREIKFRAWSNKSNKMYWFDIMNGNAHGTGSGYISMTPFGEPITKHRHKDNMIEVDPEDCEIMQFSGLKDKNGKEIYEGDIVSHKTNDGSVVKNIIIYADGGFKMKKVYEIALLNTKDWHHTEVIGNVHENLELLNP